MPQVLDNGTFHDWRVLLGPYGRVATVYQKASRRKLLELELEQTTVLTAELQST